VTSLAGVVLLVALALPPAVAALESRMATHAAVQIPLLAAAGYLAARPLAARGALGGWNGDGLPALLVAAGVGSVWMLPRAMDAALVHPVVEIAKFVSLPALVGAPLALGWRRLSPLVRGFVWANAISMLATLGWLYHAAPTRACNAYTLDAQRALGRALLAAAFALALGWTIWAFVRPRACVSAAAHAARMGAADHSRAIVLPSSSGGTRSAHRLLARDL
jgi:hypothetical protein